MTFLKNIGWVLVAIVLAVGLFTGLIQYGFFILFALIGVYLAGALIFVGLRELFLKMRSRMASR